MESRAILVIQANWVDQDTRDILEYQDIQGIRDGLERRGGRARGLAGSRDTRVLVVIRDGQG